MGQQGFYASCSASILNVLMLAVSTKVSSLRGASSTRDTNKVVTVIPKMRGHSTLELICQRLSWSLKVLPESKSLERDWKESRAEADRSLAHGWQLATIILKKMWNCAFGFFHIWFRGQTCAGSAMQVLMLVRCVGRWWSGEALCELMKPTSEPWMPSARSRLRSST